VSKLYKDCGRGAIRVSFAVAQGVDESSTLRSSHFISEASVHSKHKLRGGKMTLLWILKQSFS
jgi:hypothetical protein